MSDIESLVLNPVEFTPDLTEIDLNELGLSIAAEGLDYGESSVTVERVRQAIGEGITDAHWPSVEATVPLIARPGTDFALADPLHRLEGWVADVQRRRTGWIKRTFSTDGGFAGSVGCPVDSAGLTPAQGWLMAHNQVATGITLKLSRYPFWFATVEEESEEFTASAVRDLTFELADLLGTVPGLIRVQVKNTGTEDWRGCLLAIECDDFSSDETALPKYEAQKLTPKGGAEVKEVSGAKVVKCPPLTAGWQTVLYSEIAGVGQMTHVGPRRVAFRIDDVSTEVGDVQWKLEWRQLGSANWIQTTDGSTPLVAVSPCVGGYQLVDLGECSPERALAGEQRWEWRLQAMSLSGSGKQPLIRDVYPSPTEQWMLVKDMSEDMIDGEPAKAPGTVEDATGVGTVAWSNPSRAKVEDLSFATATLTEEISHYLKATNFGFALPSTATIKGIKAVVVRRESLTIHSLHDYQVRLVKGGAIQSAEDKALPGNWHASPASAEVSYGGSNDLWSNTWLYSDINASTFGLALAVQAPGAEATAEIDAIKLIVAYSESSNENRVCFAERSLQFTDTGIRRQHVTDEVWGDLMPEGFLPYAPVPGQAGQTMRGLLIPSVGDFDKRADSASVKLAAKVAHRPGYLFAREAAE